MHGLFRRWLYTLSAELRKCRLRIRALLNKVGIPLGFQVALRPRRSNQRFERRASEFEPDRGWSRDQFDTPTDHFERVPSDYVPKEGEEVYEFFVRQHSTGVWRVTRKAEVPKEERTC